MACAGEGGELTNGIFLWQTMVKSNSHERNSNILNSWVSRDLEKLRLPRARPQTRPDARTRNVSKGLPRHKVHEHVREEDENRHPRNLMSMFGGGQKRRRRERQEISSAAKRERKEGLARRSLAMPLGSILAGERRDGPP